jgi:hypothetical protein
MRVPNEKSLLAGQAAMVPHAMRGSLNYGQYYNLIDSPAAQRAIYSGFFDILA